MARSRLAGGTARSAYGWVVDRVNVSVLLYVPVRSGSLALISCLKPTSTTSLETGAVQLVLLNETWSGSASENAPLVRWPGSLTLSVASPAVLTTFAVVPDLALTVAITSDPTRPARSEGYFGELMRLVADTVVPEARAL